MRNLFKKLFFFLLFLFFIILPSKVEAATIFQDNFDQYLDDSFPTKWVEYIQPVKCSAPWQVKNGEVGIKITQSNCNAHIIPNITEWPSPLSDYAIDFDIRFISGMDRHIDYRINTQIPFFHVVHFVIPGDFAVDTDNSNFLTNIHKTYTFNTRYHFKIVVTSTRLQVYESDDLNPIPLLVRDVVHLNPIPAGTFGLGSNPGSGGGTTETWFDNVVVSTVGLPNLNVPLIKQTDSAWANQTYDSANIWAPFSSTISRWGCALTSAVMVFQFHGINKLPDGTSLNPGTLNTWLKLQNDGYIGNGFINWLALSRLSKLAKNINGLSFDALEYLRKGFDTIQLRDDLDSGNPGILEEPGHFVVAKGVDNTNHFLINDPFNAFTSLSSYGDHFSSLGRFIPHNTDLSYVMVVTDNSTSVVLRDGNGQTHGESFVQNPLTEDGGLLSNGNSINVFYFAQPSAGGYTLDFSSQTLHNYQAKIYLYDKDGNVKIVNGSGIVAMGDVDKYSINFNKDNSSRSVSERIVTYDTLITDITTLYSNNELNFSLYLSSLTQAQVARDMHSKSLKNGERDVLKAIDRNLSLKVGKGVTSSAYLLLHLQITTLLAAI